MMMAVHLFGYNHKMHDHINLPYLSLRPTVHLNTPPKATSSPNITENGYTIVKTLIQEDSEDRQC